jgi:hypothetical protein
MPMAAKTKAEILRERSKLHRKMADLDMQLAALETAAAPATAPSSPASVAEIVDLAIAGADLRATTRRSA